MNILKYGFNPPIGPRLKSIAQKQSKQNKIVYVLQSYFHIYIVSWVNNRYASTIFLASICVSVCAVLKSKVNKLIMVFGKNGI